MKEFKIKDKDFNVYVQVNPKTFESHKGIYTHAVIMLGYYNDSKIFQTLYWEEFHSTIEMIVCDYSIDYSMKQAREVFKRWKKNILSENPDTIQLMPYFKG